MTSSAGDVERGKRPSNGMEEGEPKAMWEAREGEGRLGEGEKGIRDGEEKGQKAGEIKQKDGEGIGG